MRKAFSTLVLVALGLASLAGRADTAYLYWQVNQDSSSADAIEFEFARIGILNASDGTPVGNGIYLTQPANSSTPLYVASSDGYNVDTSVASLIGSNGTDYNSSAYSFIVELVTYQKYNDGLFDVVGRSAPISYESIQNSIAYNNTGLPSLEGAMAPTSFTRIVPEPTSGLMFLVGGALLALRRKRRA